MVNNIDHFKLYKEYVEKWIGLLGLRDWEYNIRYSTNEDEFASCEYNLDGRIAIFNIRKDISKPDDMYTGEDGITEDYIERAAIEEVCHLLLIDVTTLVTQKKKIKELDKVEHIVIKRLENLLIKYLKGKEVI